MWEWTTEHGRRTIGDPEIDATLTTDYAVRRGGSFIYPGTGYPLCSRHSNLTSSNGYYSTVGFRVVLYVK